MAKQVADDDAQFFERLRILVTYHESMLRDDVRNRTFAKALKKVVRRDTRVLDIGSGSGIWAIYAAMLGASNVTAIEAEPALLPIIQAHALENGVGDRLRLEHGHSKNIDLGEKFDVVISETIGNHAFDEGIISTLLDAKQRFLAPGGTILPRTVTLVAAPAAVARPRKLPRGVKASTEYLRRLSLNMHSKRTVRKAIRLLAGPMELLSVNIQTMETEPVLSGLKATWHLDDLSRADAVVIWPRMELVAGVELDAWDTSSWTPAVCPFEPFEIASNGQLGFDLNMVGEGAQFDWTVPPAIRQLVRIRPSSATLRSNSIWLAGNKHDQRPSDRHSCLGHRRPDGLLAHGGRII